jgi:hypothetical protein
MNRKKIIWIVIILIVGVIAYIQISSKKKYHYENMHFKIIAANNSHAMTKNEEMAMDLLYNRIKNLKEVCMWKMSFKFGDYGYVFESCTKDKINNSGEEYAQQLFIVRHKAFNLSKSNPDDNDYVWVMDGSESYWIFNINLVRKNGNKSITISNDIFVLTLSE